MMNKRDFNPFNRVRVEVPNTNQFDLSFDNKLTLDIGKLVPVLVQETLPGDKFTITPEVLVKFAPMIFPIMHRIDVSIHFFYVPNRILWNKWENFLKGEDFHPPYFQSSGMANNWTVEPSSIWDYLGLPLSDNLNQKISAFPYLAYARIFNEYYQDQNNDSTFEETRDLLETLAAMNGLITADDLSTGSTDYMDITPFQRAWEHDYFTSALPWAQKGDAVNIPLALGTIPVESAYIQRVAGGDPAAGALSTDGNGFITDVTPDLLKIIGEADGSNAEITGTINQLRVAMQLQKFLEKNARSGTRYPELIKAHFGVDVGDSRISRPEYIGGIKNNVMISEVLQTSASDGTSALGDYAGYGTAAVGGNQLSYYTPEHGIIIGIMSVVPKTAYFQGINKKHQRFEYLDYYWQEFAHIGEQVIKNKELYFDEIDGLNEGDFGYIPRYSEYKYNPSEVHGNFRTDMLDFHLARNFGSRPVLNEEFIYINDDKRIFAVQDSNTNSLYSHIWFDIKASRKIPFFTDPGGL